MDSTAARSPSARASGQAAVTAGSAPVLQRPRKSRPRRDDAQVGAASADGAAADALAAAQGRLGLAAAPAQGVGAAAEPPPPALDASQSLPASPAGAAGGRARETQGGAPAAAAGGALAQPGKPARGGPGGPLRANVGQQRLPRRTRAVAARRAAVVPHLAAVGALVHAFACSGDLDTAFRLYQQARPRRFAYLGRPFRSEPCR